MYQWLIDEQFDFLNYQDQVHLDDTYYSYYNQLDIQYWQVHKKSSSIHCLGIPQLNNNRNLSFLFSFLFISFILNYLMLYYLTRFIAFDKVLSNEFINILNIFYWISFYHILPSLNLIFLNANLMENISW